MGIIIWLIVGGICGWLASIVMRTDGQQGIFLNIIVGIVGAAIALVGIALDPGISSAVALMTAILLLHLAPSLMQAVIRRAQRTCLDWR